MRNLVFLAQFCTSQMWLTACETSLGRETGLLSSRDAPNATHGDDREIRIAYIQLLGRHPESTKTEMTTIVLSTNRPHVGERDCGNCDGLQLASRSVSCVGQEGEENYGSRFLPTRTTDPGSYIISFRQRCVNSRAVPQRKANLK